ncbi:MAG: hypothetical protein RIC06_13410 [Cyclobacteriaceae bacterium]
MNYLSESDLTVFFEKNNNRYINAVGMKIGWTEKDGIWTYLVHQTYDQGPREVSISTKFDTPETFSSGFKLESFQDLDRLNYTNSWMRYLNGKAEIIIKPLELEIPVSFRIHNYKTIIFSLEGHFYDEEQRHLTMPEDFEEYFDQNEYLLNKINERNL